MQLQADIPEPEDLRRIGYAVRWRFTPSYELPEERTAVVYFKGTKPDVIEDWTSPSSATTKPKR